MSSLPSSSPKKVLFKDFANDHRSRLSEKYPFLTNQQIQAKLKQLWKKICQENKEMSKNNESPKKGKSSNPVGNKKSPVSRKHLSWNTNSRGSPSKGISEAEDIKSLGSPALSKVDSGPWYDEMTVDSQTDSPRKSQENFTEDTVKNVIDHELNIEEQEHSPQEESTIVKTETLLSVLFPSTKLSLENEELGTRQRSRLLSSQEEQGDSNFNLMFDEEEKIFL